MSELLMFTAYAACNAVIACVYIMILPDEKPFSYWFELGHVLGKDKTGFMERWWAKPIWFCEKCLSGQIALWSGIYYGGSVHLIAYYIFLSVILSMLTAKLINKYIL